MFQELEELEHKQDLPYEVVNALAWWIASELIRRHPNMLRVIETHPGGGMYDCLSIVNRETGQGLIDLNRNGRIRIRRYDPRRGEGEIFVEWVPVLMLGRRRKKFISSLQEALDLPTHTNALPTHKNSIGVRLLANLANRFSFSNKTWDLRNAWLDTSGYGEGPQTSWTDQFPKMDRVDLEGDCFGNSHYRYWFLIDFNKTPKLLVDADRGLAWDSQNVRFDLMEIYSSQKSIDALVHRIGPLIE